MLMIVVVVMMVIVMVTLLLQILRWVPGTRQGQGMGLCLDFKSMIASFKRIFAKKQLKDDEQRRLTRHTCRPWS